MAYEIGSAEILKAKGPLHLVPAQNIAACHQEGGKENLTAVGPQGQRGSGKLLS